MGRGRAPTMARSCCPTLTASPSCSPGMVLVPTARHRRPVDALGVLTMLGQLWFDLDGEWSSASAVALPEPFVGTTWTGTGLQENPANTWPVTVVLDGGNEGEVIGTIDYPTLGCGGEIILTEVNTEDNFGSFWAQEHITYGQDNCIDGGQFLFHLSEGAFLLNFNWTSPSGPTTATGQLEPV